MTLNPGDTVAYTREFLHAVGKSHDMASRRGTVEAIDNGYAVVAWSDGRELHRRVNVFNICRLRSVAFVERARR